MENTIDIQEQVKSLIAVILELENSDTPIAKAFSGGSDTAKDQAGELISKPDYKKHICNALKSMSNDVYGISEKLTPVLVGLAIANPALIPANPLLFAWAAIIISRAGINTICAD